MNLTRLEHRELLRALRLEQTIPSELLTRAEEHIQTCAKCQRVLEKTRRLKTSLKPVLRTSHPSAEDLLAYLSTEDSVPPETTTSIQSIQAHVKTCAFCQNRLAHLQGEIKQVENVMRNVAAELRFEQDYQAMQPTAVPRPQPSRRKMSLPPMPKAMLPVASACVVLLFVFFLSLSTQPKTYPLANLNTDRLDVLPSDRGVSSAEINLKLIEGFINTGDYDKARKKLAEVDVSVFSTDQLLRVQLCDLMLTLKFSHRSFIHLFPHFEKSEVQTSLQRMDAVLSLLSAPKPGGEAYWGLAHYYSAKAYLVLEDEEKALSHLQKARLTAHQRRPATDELLRALAAK